MAGANTEKETGETSSNETAGGAAETSTVAESTWPWANMVTAH